jgi:rod shape-determining protein MreD
VSIAVVLRTAAVVFVAAVLQTAVVASLQIGGGAPNLLLVVVISIGLLRGAVTGAVAGFGGGIVVDLATLDTLGVTSLVLTLAGFWAGRYGETTGRGRRLAPVFAVAVITALAGVFAFLLRYLLGEEVVAEHALVTALVPAVVLNTLLALPVYALVRAVVREAPAAPPAREVEVVA